MTRKNRLESRAAGVPAACGTPSGLIVKAESGGCSFGARPTNDRGGVRATKLRSSGLGVLFGLACLTFGSASGVEKSAFPEFKSSSAREYLHGLIPVLQSQLGTNAEGLYTQARLGSYLGDKEEAERLARAALLMDTNRADIGVFLADILIRQDRMEDAEVFLRKAVQANPKVEAGQRQLGMVLDRLGKRGEAETVFRQAVSVTPGDATARLLLGRLLLDLGKTEEAGKHLEEACRLDPDTANPYYPLSQAKAKLGDKKGAEEALKRFQELKKTETAGTGTLMDNPKEDAQAMRAYAAKFHVEVAAILLREKKGELAESHLRQALLIEPEDLSARELLNKYYLENRRLADARRLLEETVEKQPQLAGAHVDLGTLLLQLKDYPAAVKELKRALELEPKQKEALNNLSRYYLGSRTELPEALALAERLAECEPVAASYDLLGWALYANGQTNAALKAVSRAMELAPGNPVYRQRFERLQTASGLSRK